MKHAKRQTAPPPPTLSPALRTALFLTLLVACYALSVQSRFAQLEAWRKQPELNFVEGIPMMTTHDAFTWTKWAKNYRTAVFEGAGSPAENKSSGAPDFFPDPVPLLSFMLAGLSHWSGADVYNVGLYLIPFLSGLFIFPLGLFFRKAGSGPAGMLAGLTGAFCYEYALRTCIGRIDTDSLNLFFPSLAAWLILLSGDSRTVRASVCAALAGLTCLVFNWWYGRPLFTLAFFGALVVFHLARRGDKKTVLACAAAFALFANPLDLWEGVLNFLHKIPLYANVAGPVTSTQAPGVSLPNVFLTISEAEHLGVMRNLELVQPPAWLSLAGLVLFGLFTASRFRVLVPILPLLAAGLFAFVSGRRFTMYLGPFVGAGIGWALAVVTERLSRKWAARIPWLAGARYAVAAAFFAAILPLTAYSYVPTASIPSTVFSAVLSLKERVPADAWIWNYWDYGYLINDVAGLNVYNDGSGTQFTPVTYFMARGYSSQDPDELSRVVSFVHANRANPDPNPYKMDDLPKLLEKFSSSPPPSLDKPVYVFFTANMLRFVPLLRLLGQWDLRTGKPQIGGYSSLQCWGFANRVLECDSGPVNLNDGTLNGKPALARALFIHDGKSVDVTEYGRDGAVLEVVLTGNAITHVLLMNESYYESNLNQMYVLGNYDRSLFEEIENRFPWGRLFRVLPRDATPLP